MNAIVIVAALSAALSIAAGAFGAHGASLKAAELLRTGAQYQLLHAVAAIAVLQIGGRGPAWLFLAGGGLFGVSLYLLALGVPRGFGAVTPIGGALMIGGWLWLAWTARG